MRSNGRREGAKNVVPSRCAPGTSTNPTERIRLDSVLFRNGAAFCLCPIGGMALASDGPLLAGNSAIGSGGKRPSQTHALQTPSEMTLSLCPMCSLAVQPNHSQMGGKWWSPVDVGGISEVTK